MLRPAARTAPARGPKTGEGKARSSQNTRSFETLLRYLSAAMAEFMRALRTLKALQAEQARPVERAAGAALALAAPDSRRAARATLTPRARPNEPERLMAYALPDPPGRALHEQAAPWLPNEPEAGRAPQAPAPAPRTNPNPQPQPRIGQTIAPDDALASAAALLQRTSELRLKTKRT